MHPADPSEGLKSDAQARQPESVARHGWPEQCSIFVFLSSLFTVAEGCVRKWGCRWREARRVIFSAIMLFFAVYMYTGFLPEKKLIKSY